MTANADMSKLIEEAERFERAAQTLRNLAKPKPRPTHRRAVRGRPRLEPGRKLEHHDVSGKVTATCTYRGKGRWVFGGRDYATPSAAASAAAKKLRLKSTSVNGWLFWGLKRPAAEQAPTVDHGLSAAVH